MIIKKKCPACNHWAVFELAVFCKGAVESCTCCRHTTRNITWDSKAQEEFAQSGRRFEELCEKHPELRNLKGPGDAVKIDEE